MKVGQLVVIGVIGAALALSGVFLGKMYLGEAPVTLPAPVIEIQEGKVVNVPAPKVDVHVDLASVHREILALQRIVLEQAYGEGCWNAPSGPIREKCVEILK